MVVVVVAGAVVLLDFLSSSSALLVRLFRADVDLGVREAPRVSDGVLLRPLLFLATVPFVSVAVAVADTLPLWSLLLLRR